VVGRDFVTVSDHTSSSTRTFSYIRLCNVRFTTVKANIDLKDVTISTYSGDFSATSLAHVINTETLNKLVVQTWLDRAGPSSSPSLLGRPNTNAKLFSQSSQINHRLCSQCRSRPCTDKNISIGGRRRSVHICRNTCFGAPYINRRLQGRELPRSY
jgi:hypothetical protein